MRQPRVEAVAVIPRDARRMDAGAVERERVKPQRHALQHGARLLPPGIDRHHVRYRTLRRGGLGNGLQMLRRRGRHLLGCEELQTRRYSPTPPPSPTGSPPYGLPTMDSAANTCVLFGDATGQPSCVPCSSLTPTGWPFLRGHRGRRRTPATSRKRGRPPARRKRPHRTTSGSHRMVGVASLSCCNFAAAQVPGGGQSMRRSPPRGSSVRVPRIASA
jgi:hypothetical protein